MGQAGTDQNKNDQIISLLERRLPDSCYMYNQIILHKKFNVEKDLKIFTFEDKSSPMDADNIWIIFKTYRGDWNECVTISPPTSVTKGCQQISRDVQIFLETVVILDWSKPFIFIVDQNVSDFLIQLNVRKICNVIKIVPTHLFYMDPVEALNLKIPITDPSIKLGPLLPADGEAFITSGWPYTRAGTGAYARNCIENGLTAGVYVNGELVCAAFIPGREGLISALITHPSHRRKGYASLLIKYSFREMARQGLHPCLDAEISDKAAVAFHKSVNPRIISNIDYLCHKALM